MKTVKRRRGESDYGLSLNWQIMYERSLQFPGPRNTAVVWRYMPFVGFVDLLQRQKLFFSRLEKLVDPHEGFYNAEMKDVLAGKVPMSVIRATERLSRRNYCVNCWHESDGESTGMWDIYSRCDGVAVRSTVKRLKESLHSERRRTFIANVHYGSATAPTASPLASKRKSFEHEREVRMWCLEADRTNGQDTGVYISVDLAVLIEAVFVSPTAGEWVTQVAQSTLDLHGFHIEAVQSKLYSKALV